MKKRLPINKLVYIVLPEGVIRGIIKGAMNRGLYKVETFLGNVTVTETKIYDRNDFSRACNLYESLYGVK